MEGLEKPSSNGFEWQLKPFSMHFRFLSINHNLGTVKRQIKGEIVCFGGCHW